MAVKIKIDEKLGKSSENSTSASKSMTTRSMLKLLFSIIVAQVFFVTACTDDSDKKQFFSKARFFIERAGNKAEFDFQVKERREYIVSLQFDFGSCNQEDRLRVKS